MTTDRVRLGSSARIRADLTISQGADRTFRFKWGTRPGGVGTEVVGYDLTGWSARAQLRAAVGGRVWVTLTTEEDEIVLNDPDDGNIAVIFDHEVTEAIAWNNYDKGVWDLELIDPSGEVLRLMEGTVVVKHDVTRV